MLLVREPVMAPDTHAAEKTREHDLTAEHFRRIMLLKISRDNAELAAQFPNVVALFAKNPNYRMLTPKGIDLPQQQLKQGRFPAPFGPRITTLSC